MMGVVMKGGTSGNREDGLPKVTVPFDPQTIQNTAGSGGASATVHMKGGCSGNREGDPMPPVPTGGTPDDSAT